MTLHINDEIPDFGTPFWILEAERIIYTVWFGPHNKSICRTIYPINYHIEPNKHYKKGFILRKYAPCCRWYTSFPLIAVERMISLKLDSARAIMKASWVSFWNDPKQKAVP